MKNTSKKTHDTLGIHPRGTGPGGARLLSLNLFLCLHFCKRSLFLLMQTRGSAVRIKNFSHRQRSQTRDPHLYEDERFTICHLMECSTSWSFSSHTYFERLVCVDLARFSKDCLWLPYLCLKVVSVEPIYVFVPWLEETSAL